MAPMLADVSLWGLFLSAFVSATLFPGGSEVVLGVLAAARRYDPWWLLAIVSLGNTLGALTTWTLGALVARRFPLSESRDGRGRPRREQAVGNRHAAKQRRAVAWLRRWGSPALLLSWLPVVGDPLCFAAGFLRLPFALSLLFIALGKTARYAVVLVAVA